MKTCTDLHRKVIPLHRVSIDGPYTRDTQEHHDWETDEHRKLLSLEGYSFLRKLMRVGLCFVAAALIAGVITSMFHLDLSALAFVPWGHQ